MLSDPSDSELIVATLDEPELFSVIFERHYSAVFGFVGASVAVSEVDDIASEVFVRAFGQRDRFNPDYRSARPWLLGIASHLIADHYRTIGRRDRAYRRVFAREPRNDRFDDDAANRIDAAALSPLLQRAIRNLRPQQVPVVVLFVLEDFSYSEIATALEIPEGTVRSRLSRARGRLRNSMAEFDEHNLGETNE